MAKSTLASQFKGNNLVGSMFNLGIKQALHVVDEFSDKVVSTDAAINALGPELVALEGHPFQNPETGAGVKDNATFLKSYTNRLFGAPYQFLDSVDRRFEEINTSVGSEYLRNILLDAPILRIKPGMPKYTGSSDSGGLVGLLKSLYVSSTIGGENEDMGTAESLLLALSKDTVFKKGKQLQRRMFGFRETYYDYMQYVNYQCRSVAVFMNLTTGDTFPDGAFSSTGYQHFASFNWENYRMMKTSQVSSPLGYVKQILGAAADGPIAAAESAFVAGKNLAKKEANKISKNVVGYLADKAMEFGDNPWNTAAKGIKKAAKEWNKTWEKLSEDNTTVSNVMANKICTVEFMVNPVSYTENLSNETASSMIETAIDGLNSIGSEIQFITNSHADTKVLESLTSFLGDASSTAAQFMSKITDAAGGGFTTNLFNGALQSIKGQKMIYPKIYKSSNSSMDYEFSMTLTTPYGDNYNYYMNIVVPLIHLINLVAPRMVTSNTITSPFLVQFYVPGQCSCNLGIVKTLTIRKNPNNKHVSAAGFPLTVEVNFTIEELYNAMSISPANDPASFLYNETLNDYMCNLAGLIPSMDTFIKQNRSSMVQLDKYITDGGFAQEFAEPYIEKFEDWVNPFAGR